MDLPAPAEGYDWLGNDWKPGTDVKGAHPNSRFTAPASQCPTLSPKWQDPQGVPISAIIFGGRRARLAPLVYQSFDWKHGVYVGATMASEKTAAAEGKVGEVRRAPMAMLPFCGYNMGRYFGHWLMMGHKIKHQPKIFHVNWFRKDKDGHFLWPGFGENIRVLIWIAERAKNAGKATETPIGYVPTKDSLLLDGLNISDDAIEQLLAIDKEEWKQELEDHKKFLAEFSDTLPKELTKENEALMKRLG